MVSLGTLGASLVHPREVFRLAIFQAVASVIMVHNHPSGDSTPSEEDVKLTRRLIDAGKVIGIEVLDHIIIGSRMYKSFRENGLM
jgi:DNA repair protein RadC